MAARGGTSQASVTPSRRRRFLNVPERDPKKLGIFGAPQCRCTPLVLALCVALTGLVTVGVGACMTAFMWHDNTPRGLGLALVALGVSMIAAGIGLFIYDSCVKSLMTMQPRDNPGITYSVQHQGQVQTAPAPLMSSADPGRAMGITPFNAEYERRPESHQGTAPPPYDAVLEEDSRYHLSSQQVSAISRGRGSYHSSAVRDSVV